MVEVRQYSHGRHVASDALRGLAVGIRGVLEAKRMAREAKSGREKRIADHYVRLKRQDLQERRLAISEGAATTEMEQVRLDSLQAEQEHKDEWHQRLAEAYDRLESLYRERNRATAPKEMERIDDEIGMEARAVVRLGKNLGYSYPHIEQGLQEREAAAVEFEEKGGDVSDAEAAARKEEVLQVLEENKDAFSEEEYADIKARIELGDFFRNYGVDIGDLIKSGLGNLTPTMDSGSTESDDAVVPSEFVDILVGDAESMMQAKNLTPEDYVMSVESQLRERYPELSDEEIGSLMAEFREKADFLGLENPTPTEGDDLLGVGNPTPTEEGSESEDPVFDRAPKETDFKHRDADGVEHNLHAEVAYMIAIEGWSREEVKAQLRKDYPELSEEQIEIVLNDPEFEYPEDVE